MCLEVFEIYIPDICIFLNFPPKNSEKHPQNAQKYTFWHLIWKNLHLAEFFTQTSSVASVANIRNGNMRITAKIVIFLLEKILEN